MGSSVLVVLTALVSVCMSHSPLGEHLQEMVRISGGTPVTLQMSNLASETCNEVGKVTCLNCRQMSICLATGPKEISCPQDYSCVKNGCSRNTSCEDFPDIDPNYSCPGNGFHPLYDENCTQFRYCSGGVAYKLECKGANNKYNPNTELCDVNVGCDMPCENELHGKIALKNSQYYAFCNNKVVIAIFKCPDQHTFDDTEKECLISCQSAGRHSKPKKCRDYYECVREDGGFRRVHRTCPPLQAFWFNDVTKKCELMPQLKPPKCAKEE